MHVVSGCPRSGTSLFMLILSRVFGRDRIYGEKFPQKKQLEFRGTQQERETDERFRYRQFLQSIGKSEGRDIDLESIMDMNPNGFWECPFTVRGLRFSVGLENELTELVSREKTPVVKIVSQGLAKSDPQYIDKIIYMVRPPRAVAKSQEKLDRQSKVRTEDGQDVDLFGETVVHSPKMFIDVTISAMHWVRDHPDVPIMLVHFDDLIDSPGLTLEKVEEFLAEDGNWESGAGVVDSGLRRSYPQNKKSNLWRDAEYIYEALVNLDFEALDRFESDPKRHTYRESRAWQCARTGLTAMEGICRGCHLNASYREKLIEHAAKVGAPWRELPCAYEVAYNLDSPLISIEESIAKNHWVEPDVAGEELNHG